MNGDFQPGLRVRRGEQGQGGVLMALVGELDVHTSAQLREAVVTAVLPGSTRLLRLDLSEVTYCDAGGLYSLLGVTDALEMIGVPVEITSPSPAARAVMDTTDLGARLPLRRPTDGREDDALGTGTV
ncbi:STAS domain-containing protein [Streptomyces sp. NPDC054842]